MANARQPTPFGHALRRWRSNRRLSQLELAGRAGTPSRHVSFLETGRSRPTRDMVLRLGAALDLPLAERNALLGVAGFAPHFPERTLDDAALAPIRVVIERMLASHAPYPAIVLDRWYDILGANVAGSRFFCNGSVIDPDDPPNLIDLILGPLRALVVNWDELVWGGIHRLREALLVAPDDDRLADHLSRLEAAAPAQPQRPAQPVLFSRLCIDGVALTTLSTLVRFGGANDVTVDGLHLELIFPADDVTDAWLRALGA